MKTTRPKPDRPAPAPRPPLGAAAGTPVGVLGSPHLGVVDGAGSVAPSAAGWHLTWWVGAEDRWYRAEQERAVRQGLLEGSPVVETWMRVPGGDAVQRVWAVPGDGGPAVVVEVENASPVPVALAFALVPGGLGIDPTAAAASSPRRVELRGPEVVVDGEVALVLEKEANRAAATSEGGEQLAVVVTEGGAEEAVVEPVVSPSGQAALALVVPLPHTARVRALLPLGGAAVRADVADAAAVARGWTAQADRGSRIELPDERLQAAVVATRRQLLLWAQGSGDLSFASAADVAAALARVGLGDEALAVLAELTARPEAARRLGRRGRDGRARGAWVDAVERTRDAVGDELLAEHLGGAPKGTARRGPRAPAGDLDVLLAALATAGPTWAWAWGQGGPPDPVASAAFLGLACDALVHEVEHGVDLLPTVPPSWFGQGVDVHDLPTPVGSLSFAVRWHGERPAVLWELVGPADGEVRLRLPGLDPEWSSTDTKGEALLAVPADAVGGSGAPGGQAQAAAPPDAGGSWS